MLSQKTINLLPKDRFEFSSFGRLVKWTTSVGRWIVVLTEFVVIAAFLSRFYFDTKLANLFDDLKQKRAIVASALTFEENFRQTQEKIQIIKSQLAYEKKPSLVFSEIAQLSPPGVFLTQISLDGLEVSLSGYVFEIKLLNLFLTGMTRSPTFTQVNLTDISSAKDDPSKITFNVIAKIANQTNKKSLSKP